MANENAAAPDGGQVQGENQPQGLGGIEFKDIARMIFWFFVFQNVAKLAQERGILPGPSMPNNPEPEQQNGPATAADAQAAVPGKTGPLGATNPTQARPACLWSPRTEMDLHVFFTASESFELPDDYDYHAATTSTPTNVKDVLDEWHESGLKLYDSNEKRSMNITIPLSKQVRYNETHLYAHIRLARRRPGVGKQRAGDVRKVDILSKRVELTKYRLRKKVRDEKSLLGDDHSEDDGEEPALKDSSDKSPLSIAGRNKTHDQILLFASPSLTLQLVDMKRAPNFPSRTNVPKQFGDHMDWLDDASSGYYPVLYPSEFWITKESLLPINGTTREITLEATFEPISMWKWQIMSNMEQSWRQQEQFMGDEDSSGSDMFRTLLLETNPFLLAVTGIVSVLHTIFDMLAFKNDISFFKGRKSMEGLSLRSMIVNAFFQVVILAYLADNETSFMVLASNGMGLAIEIWKISKAISVSFADGKIQWVETKSYTESKTKAYDEIATSHLLYITMPLVTGYGLYSLVHQKHKGYYSWILNTLVGFIYMFGFVMMTPQLFINYKLQSVAHLNWRTMTYKSISTFIDDLFAFVIKMPIMHRLACLRDDIVFFIFCYQRYIYRTDYTRVNEFGQCSQPTEEMLEELEEEKEAKQQTIGTNTTAAAETTSTTAVRQRRGARDKRN
mmetsp:Transcript_33033/g.72448  ORF Transcript_33033/g.72448 Transcript_33033/m.72448 type:complete len:674 (-) Transcript_33033:38-2059(-)|eukprot:CAMPEP_0178656266 /NCGR_PEP_ID=MMETSP0698-20121128/24721_1 /TAXON_ID=265572 /ORGANISM="Extubocellulus spinifer, Strain CCMP396" /LENGTH=673 /DNA_ID=CAMNT_0020298287 /DNA_START=188 /DNA_END=2206 /DNA_ORIENTATION=+